MATVIDISAIEATVKQAFDDDSAIDALVTTFAAGLRSDIPEARRLALGFGPSAMPALLVTEGSPLDKPIRTEGDTFGEDDNRITFVAFIVERKSTEAAAKASVIPIREQVERVVKKQRTATNNWSGLGPTMKESIRNGLSVIEDGDTFVAIAEVEWQILHITDIEGV